MLGKNRRIKGKGKRKMKKESVIWKRQYYRSSWQIWLR